MEFKCLFKSGILFLKDTGGNENLEKIIYASVLNLEFWTPILLGSEKIFLMTVSKVNLKLIRTISKILELKV